jgi:hypothetical protein
VSPEKLIGYVRDAGCVLVGLGGIVYQIVTGEVNGQLLTTCMGLLGIAGGIRVWQLRPGSSGGGRSRSSPSARSGSRSRPGSSSGDGDQ